MEEKRRDYTRPLLTIAIALLSIFVGMKISQVRMPPALQSIMPSSMRQGKLSSIMDYISQRYVDTVSMDKLEEKLIPDLLKELDPHSVYIPASEIQETDEPLEGNFDGIGVSFNMATDTVIVMNVIVGGPSERAGVLAGDRIVTVNDSLIAGIKLSQDSVVHLLRGKSGTKVSIGVKREGEKKLIPISITRGKIPLKSIDVAYMIRPGMGYVKMSKFARTTHAEFRKAVDELHNEGMKALILDLRQNSGGFLDQAFEITNELLPKNKLIVYTEGRASKRKDFYSNGSGVCANDSLVVLIDESSASASEILAGAVQDNDRGLIIGRRSFGKGLVQEPVYFTDGSCVRLTIARYYTPTGRSIQKPYDKGVDAYYRDIYTRYEHGEFESADSIRQNDSLKYITPNGKTVYGGGGIMPDIFVPFDTTYINEYFKRISRRNLVYKYALAFSDENRKKLREIRNIDELNTFLKQQDLLNKFIAYAASNGATATLDELKQCSRVVKAQLDAYIGRNSPLDDSGLYFYLNEVDIAVERAVSELAKELK